MKRFSEKTVREIIEGLGWPRTTIFFLVSAGAVILLGGLLGVLYLASFWMGPAAGLLPLGASVVYLFVVAVRGDLHERRERRGRRNGGA